MKLALICATALALVAASGGDPLDLSDSTDSSSSESVEPTLEPCPYTCPNTHQPVCAESSFPHAIVWFSNSCYKRMCECRQGIGMTVRDKSVCRRHGAQWDLCPLYPPVVPPRARDVDTRHKLL